MCLDVEQMPAGVPEAEDLDTLREHLDLVRGAEDDANVAIVARGKRVRTVGRGARDIENRLSGAVRRIHVARDLDDVEHRALAIDQEQRLEPIAEAVEALDAGQRR